MIEILKDKIVAKIEFDFGTMYKTEHPFIYFAPSPDLQELDLRILEQMYSASMELCNHEPIPFLSDNRSMTKAPNQEGRIYIQQNFHHFATKSAILENNALVRHVTHLMNYLTPPKIPMRLFKDEKDAIKWLIN